MSNALYPNALKMALAEVQASRQLVIKSETIRGTSTMNLSPWGEKEVARLDAIIEAGEKALRAMGYEVVG
jgi:hypothetical protein